MRLSRIENRCAASRTLDGLAEKAIQDVKPAKIVSLERVRMPTPASQTFVLRGTKANRLRTITHYLKWLGQKSSEGLDLAEAARRNQRLNDMLKTLQAMAPPTKGRNVV